MVAMTSVADALPDIVQRRIDLAVHMVEMGAAVFPLAANSKIPLIPKRAGGGGFLDARVDADAARTFLTNPGYPNYGVAFPEGSDVIVLDIDGGDRASRPAWQDDWQRLYDKLGPPGLTYIVRTPSGGRHAYYLWPDAAGAMPPGDELLGWTVRKPWKGYVVGPGSVVNGETYEPVGLESITELALSWAQAAIEKKGEAKPIITVGGVQARDIKTGARHRYLRDRARYLLGIGLTGDALFNAVSDLNRQLPEPKTEAEVRRAIGEVEDKYEPDPIDPDTGATAKPRRVPTLLELPFHSAADIAAMTPELIDWAWTGYAAYGTIVEIVGPPKAGKTTLVFGLVKAYASREHFLGRWTGGGPVMVLTEQGPASLRAVLTRMGLSERDDVEFLMHRDVHGHGWPDVVLTAVQRCEEIGARFLVVDTLPAFAGLSGETENNAGDALAAMEPLMAAAHAGLAVLVNRHRRKGGAEDIADEGRGSSAFSGAVDVVVSLRRRGAAAGPNVRVLASASRFDETPEELYVELQDDSYVVIGDDAAIEARETRGLLVDLFKNLVGHAPVPLAQLVSDTGKSRRTVTRVLADLVNEGIALREGGGGRGKRVLYGPPTPGSAADKPHWARPYPYGVNKVGAQPNVDLSAGGDPGPRVVEPSSESINCRDYTRHQSSHRRTDAGWICTKCEEDA